MLNAQDQSLFALMESFMKLVVFDERQKDIQREDRRQSQLDVPWVSKHLSLFGKDSVVLVLESQQSRLGTIGLFSQNF